MFRKIALGFVAIVVILLTVGLYLKPTTNGPLLDFITGKQLETPTEATIGGRFQLPDGFKIGVFAANINNARMMRVTSSGDIIVSSMRPGEVILLHADSTGNGISDGRTVLLTGLDQPHGLALKDGYLYVAETGGIGRAPFDAETRKIGALEPVFSDLPPGGNHKTRTIDFGPDGWLYVTVGSTCNACIEEHPFRAAMLRMKPDGSDAEIFATGLRNTIGFDWQPKTGRLYGTDNGRDLLGDDIPHCEINLIEADQFYGWPFTFDDLVVDPDFGAGRETEIASSRAMAHGLGAHVAPMGIKFLDSATSPEGYGGKALVALHGSWNRSTLSGYKLVALEFSEDGSVIETDFLTGFEKDEDVIGRPVDIVQGADGAIYVSDDYSGTIYKIGWGDIVVPGSKVAAAAPASDPLEGISETELAAFRETGLELFEGNPCAFCHDAEVAPEGVQVKLLKKLGNRYTIESLQAFLDAPSGPMPRPDLTDEERKALAVYLLSEY